MSDTPRTDAVKLTTRCAAGILEDYMNLARTLKRENAALLERAKKAEEAADAYSKGVYSQTMLDAAKAIGERTALALENAELRADKESAFRAGMLRAAEICDEQSRLDWNDDRRTQSKVCRDLIRAEAANAPADTMPNYYPFQPNTDSVPRAEYDALRLYAHREHERAERREIRNLKQELAAAQTEIENLRNKVAGCSTAAIGYWKEGDSLHPGYECAAIHDVAKLYADYAALRAELERLKKPGHVWVPEEPTDAMIRAAFYNGFEGNPEHVKGDWEAMLRAAGEKK